MTEDLERRRPGRPKTTDPRRTPVTTHVTTSQYDAIYRAAKRERVTVSTYVKRALDRNKAND